MAARREENSRGAKSNKKGEPDQRAQSNNRLPVRGWCLTDSTGEDSEFLLTVTMVCGAKRRENQIVPTTSSDRQQSRRVWGRKRDKGLVSLKHRGKGNRSKEKFAGSPTSSMAEESHWRGKPGAST